MEQRFPVYDDHGREIGDVSHTGGRTARALDGAELGSFTDRFDADAEIRLDWMLGRPRDPHTGHRYKAVASAAPIYLGR